MTSRHLFRCIRPIIRCIALLTASVAIVLASGVGMALAAPILILDKTPDGATFFPGDVIKFTMTITNIGDADAEFPQLTDVLPGAGVIHWDSDITEADNSSCFIDKNGGVESFLCDFRTLRPGEHVTATVFATVTTCPMTLNNEALAESATAAPVKDKGSINIACRQPSLTIVKTPDGGSSPPGLINAGDIAEFMIVVGNNGASVAAGVKLTDLLPAGLTWTVKSLSGSPMLPITNKCDVNGGNSLSCDFENLAMGATRKIIVTAQTTPLTCTPAGHAGQGLLPLDNPAAKATATNAAGVEAKGRILCRTADLCDISVDKTCSVDLQPTVTNPPKFDCPDPFDGFKLEWTPGATNDATHAHIDPTQVVDLRIWNGAVGSLAPVDIGGGANAGPAMVCDVAPGETVRVSGLATGKKKPADDQYWEIFVHDPLCKSNGTFTPTTTRLGISKFRINCHDDDMKDAKDCGTLQGDGHADKNKASGLVNDWRLAGISGNKHGDKDVLECVSATSAGGTEQQNCSIPQAGDLVTYTYKVTNNSATPVTVNVSDDKKPGGVVATNKTIPGKSVTSPGVNIMKFTWGPTPIITTTVNTATVIGNPGPAQCEAKDTVVVTTPCFMGNPATRQLYPYADPAHARTSVVFNESEVLQRIEPSIASVGDTLRMWYTDEHAMLLGIRSATIRTKGAPKTVTATVSPFIAQYPANGTKLASEIPDPLTGLTEAQEGVDPAGRPIAPSLFCTDVTGSPTSIAGDWQMGGTAQGPHFISGTWKSATVTIDQTVTPNVRVITTDADPAKNGFTLGPKADPIPAGVTTRGYVTEARWNVNTLSCNGVPLQKGHTYRMQLMVHDGDQNKTGGDVGQSCATVYIPN